MKITQLCRLDLQHKKADSSVNTGSGNLLQLWIIFHSFKDEKILFFGFCFHIYGYFRKQLHSHSENFSVALKKRTQQEHGNVTKKKVIFHSTFFFSFTGT